MKRAVSAVLFALGSLALASSTAHAGLTEFDTDYVNYYTQTSAAGTLAYDDSFFASRVDQTANAYTHGTLTFTGAGSPETYTLNAAGTEFDYVSKSFASQSAMLTAFPASAYIANVGGSGGSANDTIVRNTTAFPLNQAVVTSASYTGLQGLNPAAGFAVNFNGFTPSANAGLAYEFINIYDPSNNDVFTESFLADTNTSFFLPAGTLLQNTSYVLQIVYSDRITGNSTTPTNILFDDNTSIDFRTDSAIPEPAPLAVLGVALLALPLWRRRRRS